MKTYISIRNKKATLANSKKEAAKKMGKPPRIIKGATGYYYLRKLTRSQRKEWLKEFRLHHRNHFPVTDWLSTNFTDMEDFIACSFSWGQSVKGLEYWSRISDYGRWNTKPDKLSAQHVYDGILKIHNELKS